MRPEPLTLFRLAVAACVATAILVPQAALARRPGADGSLTFADAASRRKYDRYVAFLQSDPRRFAGEIATLRKLASSEVEYHVGVGGASADSVEGSLTTDGTRVYVTLSAHAGGAVASLNSRFAHELEHARQFEDGEIAFVRVAGAWHSDYSSYDIGDEVRAWEAQLNAARSTDFWFFHEGERRPTLLARFARAETDDERARVLVERAYARLNPVIAAPPPAARRLEWAPRTAGYFGRVRPDSTPDRIARGATAGVATRRGER